nr:hypothetical protein Iba_chr05eCG15390 [Ipomoea batatas]
MYICVLNGRLGAVTEEDNDVDDVIRREPPVIERELEKERVGARAAIDREAMGAAPTSSNAIEIVSQKIEWTKDQSLLLWIIDNHNPGSRLKMSNPFSAALLSIIVGINCVVTEKYNGSESKSNVHIS